MNLISLFVTSLLTQNIILNKFLGIYPFMVNNDREDISIKLGVLTIIISIISSTINYLIYYLLNMTNITYLMPIIFILITFILTELIVMIVKKFTVLYDTMKVYLPLLTTNSAIFGISLLNISNGYNFSQMLIYTLGSSIGFTLVIYIFASIKDNLKDTPRYFKDEPIALIIAGIIAMILSRI